MKKIAPIAGFTTCIILYSVILIAAYPYVGQQGETYSIFNHFISELGSTRFSVNHEIYNNGIISLLLNKKNEAFEFFKKAHRLSEDVFEISLAIGKLCVEMKDHKNGQKYLEEAVRLNSSSSIGYRSLGECYEALNMIDPSIQAYKSAIKLNPNDSAALSSLGCLFDLKGENSEISTTFCRQSVEISPENGLYRHRLGHLYLKQNRYEDALIEFEKAHHLGYDSDRQIKKARSIIDTAAS